MTVGELVFRLLKFDPNTRVSADSSWGESLFVVEGIRAHAFNSDEIVLTDEERDKGWERCRC